ncbi:MAG TPA: hypothetical protein VMP68_32230 [Candidatus Eisenbacteria bacterium]|nr:hypothetical protein [Candidatus Eisenbacteria bacterium]
MKKSPRKTLTGISASIVDGWLYFEDVRQAELGSEGFVDIIEHRSMPPIRLVSLNASYYTQEWISGVGSHDFKLSVEMTLRPEIRSGRKFWYAYRRTGGKLQKRFVGQSDRVTTQKLLEVAQHMV